MKLQDFILKAMAKKVHLAGVGGGAGLVARRKKRASHRGRRRADSCQACYCILMAASTAGFARIGITICWSSAMTQPATSTTRSLVERRIDPHGHKRDTRGDRKRGRILRLVQRSRQPFLHNPQGGREGRSASADANRSGHERAWAVDDPSLLAASAGPCERSFGSWQNRFPQELRLAGITALEQANAFVREHYMAEFNRRFCQAADREGDSVPQIGSGLDVFDPNTANCGTRQHHRCAEPLSAISQNTLRNTLAGCTVTFCEHLDGRVSRWGPHLLRAGKAERGSGKDGASDALENLA